MTNSPHIPPMVGTIGLLGTFTVSDLNQMVGLCVGLLTVLYLIIRIYKEIKNGSR